MRIRTMIAVATTALSIAILSGCGGDGAEDGASTAGPPPDVTQPTGHMTGSGILVTGGAEEMATDEE